MPVSQSEAANQVGDFESAYPKRQESQSPRHLCLPKKRSKKLSHSSPDPDREVPRACSLGSRMVGSFKRT
jgi:hypothetical protein